MITWATAHDFFFFKRSVCVKDVRESPLRGRREPLDCQGGESNQSPPHARQSLREPRVLHLYDEPLCLRRNRVTGAHRVTAQIAQPPIEPENTNVYGQTFLDQNGRLRAPSCLSEAHSQSFQRVRDASLTQQGRRGPRGHTAEGLEA